MNCSNPRPFYERVVVTGALPSWAGGPIPQQYSRCGSAGRERLAGRLDRSRWHPCTHPALTQWRPLRNEHAEYWTRSERRDARCRFVCFESSFAIETREPHACRAGVLSWEWCRNDWTHLGEPWSTRCAWRRERFTILCASGDSCP